MHTSINQSINQYTFNTTVTVAHDYNKFKNISAKNAVAKDRKK